MSRHQYLNNELEVNEDAEIGLRVRDRMNMGEELEEAVFNVSAEYGIPEKIVRASYVTRIRVAHMSRVRREKAWVKEVTSLLKDNEDMLLIDACWIVFDNPDKEAYKDLPGSPQRMTRVYAEMVHKGLITGIKIESRFKTKITDVRVAESVRTADRKKMLLEFKRLSSLCVDTKTDMLRKIGRVFKGKYSPEVMEAFLCDQPKWDKLK